MGPEKQRKTIDGVVPAPTPKARRRSAWVALAGFLAVVAFCLAVAGSVVFGNGALSPNAVLHAIGVRENRCDGCSGCFAFCEVGQGDCSLMYDEHTVGLIDTGTYEYAKTVANRLDKLRVAELDFIVISHPHDDHAGGYEYLLERYPVRTLYIGRYDADDFADYDYYERLLSVSRAHGVQVVFPEDGMRVNFGQCQLTFYAPGFYTREENEKCLLVMAQIDGVRCLYMGDAGRLTESYLLEKGYDLRADFLKVGHHGSKTATSDAFLEQVQPRCAVISVGYNSFGHPTDLVIDRLDRQNVSLYRTDQWELILFKIEHGAWTVFMQ